MNTNTPQRVIDLFACAVRVMECEPRSILAASEPGAESMGALIRAYEFALNLLCEAIALADAAGDTNMAHMICSTAEKVNERIKDLRVEHEAWLQVPILIAQDEAERATKH